MKKACLAAFLAASCTWAAAGGLTVSVIDRDGKPVQDAIVVIVPANKSVQPKTALPSQITIAQEKMQFIPSVSLAAVGARVTFINNDPWDHHVRSTPAVLNQAAGNSPGFELRLEGKSEGKPAKKVEINLEKAGVVNASLLGCFIHGSMRGYVFVSESPWAVKTGPDGNAQFDDLPDGAAQVRVWQADQLIDLPPQQASIGATPAKATLQLAVVPRRRRT
ncbi:MAG: plastocyanin [Pseudomonadota bacterium]